MNITLILYNRNMGQFGILERTFAFLEQQTFKDFSVIFTDSNSSDDSVARVKKIHASFPISIFQRGTRRGRHPWAIKETIDSHDISDSNFILPMASEMCVRPNGIETLVHKMQEAKDQNNTIILPRWCTTPSTITVTSKWEEFIQRDRKRARVPVWQGLAIAGLWKKLLTNMPSFIAHGENDTWFKSSIIRQKTHTIIPDEYLMIHQHHLKADSMGSGPVPEDER